MPEEVGALTPLGVKSGKYNGTSKKRGVKSGHFPSHFYYTTLFSIDSNDIYKFRKVVSRKTGVKFLIFFSDDFERCNR